MKIRMAMKIRFGLALFCLALSACHGTGTDAGPQSADAFQAAFRVGDSRLLLRELHTHGRIYGYDLFSLAEIRIEKDTVFAGAPGKIFTVKATDLWPESVSVFSERDMLVAEGDSLNLYAFNGGYSGYLFNLVKTAAYDTSVFSDKTTEMIFPFAAGVKWLLRPPVNSGGGGIDKEWVARESLPFEGRDYACDVFVTHSIVPLKTWVAQFGLLKAEIVYVPMEITDTAGTALDTTLTNFERYALLKLNPSPAEIAAATEKYRALSESHMPISP